MLLQVRELGVEWEEGRGREQDIREPIRGQVRIRVVGLHLMIRFRKRLLLHKLLPPLNPNFNLKGKVKVTDKQMRVDRDKW